MQGNVKNNLSKILTNNCFVDENQDNSNIPRLRFENYVCDWFVIPPMLIIINKIGSEKTHNRYLEESILESNLTNVKLQLAGLFHTVTATKPQG